MHKTISPLVRLAQTPCITKVIPWHHHGRLDLMWQHAVLLSCNQCDIGCCKQDCEMLNCVDCTQKKTGISKGTITLLCSEELCCLPADVCARQSREGDHVISGSQGLRP